MNPVYYSICRAIVTHLDLWITVELRKFKTVELRKFVGSQMKVSSILRPLGRGAFRNLSNIQDEASCKNI